MAKVVKTNCELKPSRSSARRRSSGSNAPSASHPLRSIRFCSASAAAAGSLWRSAACAIAFSTILPPDPIASGCSLGRMSGSACEISQSRVSMMWLSASLKIRPSAYGIAITSQQQNSRGAQSPARFAFKIVEDRRGVQRDWKGSESRKLERHFSVKPRSFRRSRASLTASRWTIRRVGTAAVVPSIRDEPASKTYDSMPASFR